MDTLRDIIIVLVPMILSLTVHEFAHAWSAYLLGDNTAEREGRMTLNPTAHIDPIGTLAVPIIATMLSGFALIGWAKPVPISPYRFKRSISMRKGMILTALAGPGSNIVLALIVGLLCIITLSAPLDAIMEHGAPTRILALMAIADTGNMDLLISMGIADKWTAIIGLLLSRLFVMNLGLAIFNMIPVSPLDGSRLLPEHWQAVMMQYRMFIFMGLLLAINLMGSAMWTPISILGNGILNMWSVIF